MSVLRNLESKLAGLVEGTFSRAFKSEVRPVEIARKLAREMEQHRVNSLSRTYAPSTQVSKSMSCVRDRGWPNGMAFPPSR